MMTKHIVPAINYRYQVQENRKKTVNKKTIIHHCSLPLPVYTANVCSVFVICFYANNAHFQTCMNFCNKSVYIACEHVFYITVQITNRNQNTFSSYGQQRAHRAMCTPAWATNTAHLPPHRNSLILCTNSFHCAQ